MYRSSAIVKQWTDKDGTSLKTEEDCRMAMVWIALLGGGDYAPEGLTGFGESTHLDEIASVYWAARFRTELKVDGDSS